MEAQSKIAEIRVSKVAINIAGTALAIILCVAGIAIAQLLPHHISFADWQPLALLMGLIVLLPVHEALHGVGLRFLAGVQWRDIRFGVMWRALMPYCHCTVPVAVSGYRRMALLPLWVTGSFCLGLLLAVPADCFGALAGLAVAACLGDVWLVMKLRQFKDPLLVHDSESQVGCDVFSPTGGSPPG